MNASALLYGDMFSLPYYSAYILRKYLFKEALPKVMVVNDVLTVFMAIDNVVLLILYMLTHILFGIQRLLDNATKHCEVCKLTFM